MRRPNYATVTPMSKTGGGRGTNQYAIKGRSAVQPQPVGDARSAALNHQAEAANRPMCTDTPDGAPIDYQAQLPVFVYGTLRAGRGNHEWTLGGAVANNRPASLDGVVMWTNGSFPYAGETDDPDARVVGELIDIEPDQWDQRLLALDQLEGFRSTEAPERNLYTRAVRNIDVDGKAVQAWVYLAAPGRSRSFDRMYPRIPSGDFNDSDAAMDAWYEQEDDRED